MSSEATTKRFTKQQPKDGETILHCGHTEKVYGPHHFLGFGQELPEVSFKRPDSTEGRSKWMVLCNSCLAKYSDDPAKAIRGDSTWIGDEPAVYENFQ